MIDLLERLQFGIEKDGEALTAVVPSYRGDCTEMSDIAEEVARIYGYENIPSTRPAAPISKGETGFRHEVNERISTILSRAGLNETVTFSFMHPDQLQKLLFTESDPAYQAVPILNPITEDFPLMRTTLIPTLMDVLVRNQAVKNASVGIYEIAPVYRPKQLPLTELPEQEDCVAGLLYGQRTDNSWPGKAENYDFYDVKGMVEAILEGLGIQADLEVSDFAPLHPGKAARFVKDGKVSATLANSILRLWTTTTSPARSTSLKCIWMPSCRTSASCPITTRSPNSRLRAATWPFGTGRNG